MWQALPASSYRTSSLWADEKITISLKNDWLRVMNRCFALALFTMLMICNQVSFAQCSVEKSQFDGSPVYTHASEEVYNEDRDGNGRYYDGAHAAYVSTTATFMQEERLVVFMTVQVVSVDTNNLIARSMRFNFEDSTPMTIEADTYDKKSSSNGVVYQSRFDVSRKDILDRVAKNDIETISIIDPRTDHSITSNPYPKIFRNQIACVLERI